ncbi:pentapeptide repeat-containing protein [Abyssogena phaseoliformis symbiont]|uniref:pentapeptide repeat-containing protein n=1 Tax=Abyssogena phaseoliformis symbiont TaxID=596095 RepID=UPI001914F5BB|nr:pentapeptide repeat-containing protein [Abyssogena phaseoliformis symbiont]
MLQWLTNEYKASELDLDGCIFDLQDFTIKKDTSNLFKLFTERQFKNISFNKADLREVNLGNADLRSSKYSSRTKFPEGFQPKSKEMSNTN